MLVNSFAKNFEIKPAKYLYGNYKNLKLILSTEWSLINTNTQWFIKLPTLEQPYVVNKVT